ncbi:T9SS sorting signal type C domain-containing protein [Flavobacterium bomense]|uniref:T9SS sorting signal type C domain-containing protein n=1 Tax=Flavobacterium bomense TaxID=2497483 RepID=A0A3S0MF41_9FLAO|nr:T9SS sorting signal type C domain-containing protein [Flavobacterium bomense]RTZ07843.1 T9SS sorting signal type C domain-containing protein [Flavobacterium bomense]
MNKKLLLLIAFFFSFGLGYGQVVNYSFSQASGTYAALNGVLISPWDDFVSANTIEIGFSFNFNGINYTTCSVNSNGYITFGTTLSSATSYTPISSNTGFEGAISALGMDLFSANSPIVYSSIGSAPNRVFVLQWTNVRRYEGRTARNGDFNFQIRLNESSNTIQVIYGGCATTYAGSLTAQVGLRGLNNTDFNNRLVTNNWPTSTVGVNNTASCRTGSGSGELPLNGLTYTWTPNPIITSFTPSNACAASGVSVIITGRNFTGTTAVNFNGIPASFTVNSNTQITAQLPATATTGFITVTTSGGTGTSLSSFTVSTPAGDQISYGNNSWLGYVYANTNGSPPSNAFTTTYRGYVTQTENFDLNLVDGALSGPNVCGSYTDNFAVRFKMNRNLPAGCYTFTVGGDDGYRLSLDGGLTYVINNWSDHSYQETTSTVYLSGTTNFVLEYYENLGQSRVRFSSTFSALGIPVVGAITQPTCALATGSVSLSGLPATGSRTIIATPNTAGLTGLTGTGEITTVGGLVAGTTYTFAVSNGTCTSSVSSNVVIKPLPLVASFNGTWTNGPPTIEQSIVFSGNYTSIGNLEGCDCTVNAGVKVLVKTNHALKITNAVKVNTALGTSLTFENNSSLVQVNNDAVNTGIITYIRNNNITRETDYTYWSSPVAGQKLYDVSPKTPSDYFYSFDAVVDNWNHEDSMNVMAIGTGYIIRGPNYGTTPPPLFYEAPFVGKPNNGKIELPGIIADRSYLLGNPYPSALNANTFINNNSDVLDGTLYFWTHMTPIGTAVFNPGTGVFAYSSNDYATYNLTGGVATNPGSATSQNVSDKPSGNIAAGQAFFTSSRLAPTKNSIVFDNSMRVGLNEAILDNSQFFKVKNAAKKTNTVERHRVWLNLTNTEGAFKQILVGYLDGATNEYDSSFDGLSYNGNEFVDFYSVISDETLAIQGRALPFDENDIVPLGYSSVIQGSFSIGIDEVDGIFSSQNVYLEDKSNNSIYDLKKAVYTFSTEKGTFNDRFVLRYTDRTLGVGDFDTAAMQVLVSVKNKQIKINSSVETIDKVFIYDVLGKQIYKKTNVDNTELVIPNLGSSEQVLIVKTVLQNGETVTTKTVY